VYEINTNLIKSRRVYLGLTQKDMVGGPIKSKSSYCLKENGKVKFSGPELVYIAAKLEMNERDFYLKM
jgi:DNA-binding XRE family transcriptional regulator